MHEPRHGDQAKCMRIKMTISTSHLPPIPRSLRDGKSHVLDLHRQQVRTHGNKLDHAAQPNTNVGTDMQTSSHTNSDPPISAARLATKHPLST